MKTLNEIAQAITSPAILDDLVECYDSLHSYNLHFDTQKQMG